MIRTKTVLKILPYVAGALFAGMWAAAFEVSSELSVMENAGLSLYHDPVDVQVFWFQSKACMILPPDNYQSNCTQVSGVGVITILTILLMAVIIAYMILRRKNERARSLTGTSRYRAMKR
ncbi:MAG TPA: hypothetical protein VJZ03_02455 [Candidatus Bathyarchaeia archaeon]|nr:hypothetical protein [Candidatus Bathyarchaeia archaeon]